MEEGFNLHGQPPSASSCANYFRAKFSDNSAESPLKFLTLEVQIEAMSQPRFARWAVAHVCGVALACHSLSAQATQEDARRYFKNGVDLITGSAPNYQDAYYQFQLAYRESAQSWKVLGNLGLCALKLERDQEAVHYYELYLDKGGSDIAAEERSAIEQDMLLLQGNLATVRFSSPVRKLKITDQRAGSGAPAQLYTLEGGSLELSLRAGNHTISATDGERTLTWQVVLEPKGNVNHVFDFDAKPEPPAASAAPSAPGEKPAADAGSASGSIARVSGYAALGAGAIGLGLGGYFMWQSSDYASKSDQAFTCNTRPGGCTANERADVRDYEDQSSTAKTRGFVALGVGGAAAITGVVLLLTAPKKAAEKPRTAWVAPVVGYGAVGVVGGF